MINIVDKFQEEWVLVKNRKDLLDIPSKLVGLLNELQAVLRLLFNKRGEFILRIAIINQYIAAPEEHGLSKYDQ